jgi:hypothetical protein
MLASIFDGMKRLPHTDATRNAPCFSKANIEPRSIKENKKRKGVGYKKEGQSQQL